MNRPNQKLRVMFAVQGDGRGHMTQAIACKEMLARHGHQVVAVVAGQNQSRQLPGFFTEAFEVPVQPFACPGFSMKSGRAISTFSSVLHFFRHLKHYRGSLRLFSRVIEETRPDLIVNFLDPLMGYFNWRRMTRVPTLAVAHHFMFNHPRYPRIGGFPFQRFTMGLYVSLTGARAARLALSFYPGEDQPEKKLFVCPPILRRQLFGLAPDPKGQFLLVYILNHGYELEIEQWHRVNPEIPVHCFYDKPGAPPEEQRTRNLTFHALHGEKYLRMMAACRGVVCTAGFESVSEAAYLGKPLLMVPVENHPEQTVNAKDAELAGLGIYDARFHLSRLLDYRPGNALQDFRRWVDQAEGVMVRASEWTARHGAEVTG